MKKRGQLSVEYLLIVALVLISIIPIMIMFREYAIGAENDIIKSRIETASNRMISKAEEMYGFSPPTQSKIDVSMPGKVAYMYIYYNFTTSTPKKLQETKLKYAIQSPYKEGELIVISFPTKTPIATELLRACPGSLINEIDPECSPSNTECQCFFSGDYSVGTKRFRIIHKEQNCPDPAMKSCVTIGQTNLCKCQTFCTGASAEIKDRAGIGDSITHTPYDSQYVTLECRGSTPPEKCCSIAN